jgi:hypothetical protein
MCDYVCFRLCFSVSDFWVTCSLIQSVYNPCTAGACLRISKKERDGINYLQFQRVYKGSETSVDAWGDDIELQKEQNHSTAAVVLAGTTERKE